MPATIDGFETTALLPATLRLPLSEKQRRVLFVFTCLGGRIPRACADQIEQDLRDAHGRSGFHHDESGAYVPLFHGATMNALADRGLIRAFGDWRRHDRERYGFEITADGESVVAAVTGRAEDGAALR